ncbi:MAG: flagellar basal body P-ring formation protein FlgA [Planctomycetes bacterium]|jgi:flagella basal body P-ring formation protein FlgA|nr:flagellar basal body P-ring formation protein FlgA [Planctomycetota bacterium]
MNQDTLNHTPADLTRWGSTAHDRRRFGEGVKLVRLLLILVGLFAAVLLAEAAAASSIRLHEQAGATDDRVTLQQVAELEGETAKQLGDVVVLTLRPNQDTAELTLAQVREALAGAEINWARLTLRGFTTCRITRTPSEKPVTVEKEPAAAVNPSRPINADDPTKLEELIRRHLAGLLGVAAEDLVLDYRPRDLEKLRQTAVVGRFEIEPLNRAILGRTTLRIRRHEGVDVTESLLVSVQVSRRVMGLVAKQELRKGQSVPADAVALREVVVDDDRALPLTERALVAGQTAAVTLEEGEVVYPRHLRAAVLIKRGEVIKVATIAGGLVVRASAVALEDGGDGDVIAARNQNSRQRLAVRVTGPREATLIESDPDTRQDKELAQR